MKILLEVKENKVDFLLALLNDLPYVKPFPMEEQGESRFLNEIQEAIADVNLIKQGKLKGRPVEELINEL